MSMIHSSCGAAGLQIGGELRHRQVQHRQVHRIEQAGQRQHRQPHPLAPARPAGRICVRHASRRMLSSAASSNVTLRFVLDEPMFAPARAPAGMAPMPPARLFANLSPGRTRSLPAGPIRLSFRACANLACPNPHRSPTSRASRSTTSSSAARRYRRRARARAGDGGRAGLLTAVRAERRACAAECTRRAELWERTGDRPGAPEPVREEAVHRANEARYLADLLATRSAT